MDNIVVRMTNIVFANCIITFVNFIKHLTSVTFWVWEMLSLKWRKNKPVHKKCVLENNINNITVICASEL